MAQNNLGSSMKSYNESQRFSPRSTYREESSSTKVPDLLHDLDQKNSEIVFLNKRIQDLEKQKNEMFLDLEKYENVFRTRSQGKNLSQTCIFHKRYTKLCINKFLGLSG